MKSNVNKLMITIWCFCLASFAFANNMNDVDGTTLPGDSGALYDSGGPGANYSEYEDYTVVIDNGSSDELVLNFSEFHTENNWDQLNITCDGATSTYDDYLSSFLHICSSAPATLDWISDASVTKPGWVMNWSYTAPPPVSGCTDSNACNYNSLATSDDGSCTYAATNYDCSGNCTAALDCDGACGGSAVLDSCGVCDGGNASEDCAGTCSGTLGQGTFSLDISYADGDTQNEVYTLTASGSNWSVSNCSNFVAEGSADTSVSFSADCDLTSDFWAGAISLSLTVDDLAAGLGSMSLSGSGFSASVAGAVDLANSQGNTLNGDTNETSVGGASFDDCGVCDSDSSNDNSTCSQDCAQVWGGLSLSDGCGDCWSPYCYNPVSGTPGAHVPNYNTTPEDCAALGGAWFWAQPGGMGGQDPTWDQADLGCGCDVAAPSGCDNACGSTAAYDDCGVCDDDSSNDNATCSQDCTGTWDGSAVLDSCGQCDGGNANLDCAGLCSGSLSEGTWTNGNPGSQEPTLPPYLYGSANDGSWTLSDCYYTPGSGVNVFSDDGTLVDITAEYSTGECLFTSSVYSGQVVINTVSSHNTSDYSLAGIPSFTLNGGSVFSFSATGTSAGFDANGSLTGDLPGGTLASPNLDGDALCDDVDSDADGDNLDATTDCNDMDASVGAAAQYYDCAGVCLADVDADGVCNELEIAGCQDVNATNYDAAATDPAFVDEWGTSACTYASCDSIPDNDGALDGSQGCLWDNGTSAGWWDGWWNCPDNGGQVCGMAEVNFELDHPGATAAPHVQASYNSWCGDCYNAMADSDGDGVWTHRQYFAPGVANDFKYSIGAWVDTETVPADCANEFGNRDIPAGGPNSSVTLSSCWSSCNATCVYGCTDATACTYNNNADLDDNSCQYTDTCGFCGGGDANLDCAQECSGSLADGTFTELPGSSLSGSGSDWTLAGCSLDASTVSPINAFVLTVASDYTCDLSSNVFNGTVSVSTAQTVFANADGSASSTPAGYLFDVVLSGGTHFSFNTDAIVSGAGADGITGSITLDSFGGLVFDCNSDCGGSAAYDDCSVCAGGNTSEVANEDNLGCGCFNDSALSYFADTDDDGQGASGSASVDYCLPADDCDNVAGGCSSATLPSGWVLNDTDSDDACQSNVHDCNGVCDGPGSTATADGSCCNSGQIDCGGACDTALYGTGVDGIGTDCDGTCGGDAQLQAFTWTTGDYDGETSWFLYDSAGNLLYSDEDGMGYPDYSLPAPGCFLANEDYTLELCDSYGDSWNDAVLNIGNESYYGPYAYMDGGECLSSGFSLSGDGGCTVDFANNYDANANWHDGSCVFPATAPAGLAVTGEDSPDDYPGDIGFRLSWDTVPNAERYVLAWWDQTEAPEVGDDCDYYGDPGLIGCDGTTCAPASWLGPSYCTSYFNCIEFDWDDEVCCAQNDIEQSTDPNDLCYVAPPPTCVAGEWTVTLKDSYGDGWSGQALTIGSETYTLSSGSEAVGCYSGPQTEVTVTCSSGSYNSEVSWTIEDDAGNLVLEGGAPFDGCISCAPPADPAYTVTAGGGSWASEIAWSITDAAGNSVCADEDGGVVDCPLVDGTYTFNMTDSYGDGWTGNTASMVDASGNEIFSGFTIASGASATETFSVPFVPPIYTVTAGGGSWASEIAWSITDAAGNSVCADEDGGVVDCPLVDGTYTFNMTDSYGDGWTGNTASMVDASANVVFSGFTIASGASATETFTVPYSAPTARIVDVVEYDNTVTLGMIDEAKEIMSTYSNASIKEEQILYNDALRKYEGLATLYNDQRIREFALETEGAFEELTTRDPIGWVVVSSNAANTGFWYDGFEYGYTREFSVATVTNEGQGSYAASVTATTPVLPEPTALTVTAGAQVVDSYEYANLAWSYPTFAPAPYPNCTGTLSYIADGDCDTYNNNPECGWDGGDCCAETCIPTDAYDCTTDTTDNDSDGCWDVCYDPSTTCGEGIPTCNDDYQFGAIVNGCVSFSNSIQLFWNSGCSGSIYMDGAVLVSNTSYYTPPVNVINLDPSTDYLFEFMVDGAVVASETETASDDDCDADVVNCTGSLSYIGDGYCDSSTNNADCLWDGGDCCPGDCTDGSYSCSSYGGDCFDCLNPDSADNAVGGTCDIPDPVLGDACTTGSGSAGTIGCDLTCVPNSYLGGSFCSSGFNCEYFDYDDEVCCSQNGFEQSTDPSAVCYVAPPPTCVAGEWTVTLKDSYGDGWSGQVLTIGDTPYSLSSGAESVVCHAVQTDVAVTCSSGSYNYEVSWTIEDDAGNLVLSGSAPFDGCIGDCGPSDPTYTIAIGGGSYAYETGWDILDSTGSSIASDTYGVYTTTIALADGTYTFDMNDSYGDGWNGNTATMTDESGNVIFSGLTIDSGSSASASFTVPYSSSTARIVDIMPYEESNEVMLAKKQEVNALIAAAGFGSKEWYLLNRDYPASFENPMSHGSYYDVKSDNEVTEGYDIVTEYQVKLAENNPNSNNYRAALGFNIWKESADGTWGMIGSTTDGTTFQVTTDPVGCYAVSAYDTSPVYESGLSNTACLLAPDCPVSGDVTQDGLVNVSDIVYLVNSILGSGLDAGCADMNDDGSVNVSDVVALVNVILSGRISSANDASETVLFVSENSLKLESNGFVQGVQLTLSHDSSFEIELSDAYVSEYKTVDNQTTLILVTDGSHSINDIATFNGDMVVESIHVVNQSGDVSVEETVELVSFDVKVTGPNPFNPSTQLNIVVPEAGFVSVNVYNILGQKVATLVDGYMEASNAGHMVNFNASHLASGVYLVRAITANDVATQKLMLLK